MARSAAIAGALSLTLVLGSCASNSAPNPAAEQCETVDQVTFMTNWDGTPPTDLPVWLAQGRGYFADECLDVEHTLGKGSAQVAQLVSAGRVQFGTMSSVSLVQAAAGGEDGIVSILITYPRDPNAWIWFEESGIESPADLEGRTFGTTPENFMVALLPALGAEAGFDPDAVELVTTEISSRIPLFVSKKIDVTSLGFGETPNVTLLETGPIDRLVLSDYLPLVGYSLVARADMIESDPELTERFVRAFQRALQDLVDDPEGSVRFAAEAMQKKLQGPPPVDLLVEAGAPAVAKFMDYDDAHPVGWADVSQWSDMVDMLHRHGVIDRAIDVDDIVTNEFVK